MAKNKSKGRSKQTDELDEDFEEELDAEINEEEDEDARDLSFKAPAGEVEIEGTAASRWWRPGEDEKTQIVVTVVERGERQTSNGQRAFYHCTVVGDGFRDRAKKKDAPLRNGMNLIIWESAGLRDLSRFVGGQTVRIVPAGKLGRAKIFRFFVSKNSKVKAA